MKKFFAIFAVLVLLPLSIQAADFSEGKHYKVIKATATAKPQVLEFFSFYCGHCFNFEPFMKQLKTDLPADIEIKKNHVNFLGKQMGPMLTQAYAAAEILKVEDEVANIIFNQLHTQKRGVNGEAGIVEIFEQAGVSKADTEAALASFPVNGIAAQMKRNTETFQIRGVPALIVNGKYQVIPSSAKDNAELVELVAYLTKKTD